MEQTSSAAYPNVLVADYVKKARVASPQILMTAENYLNVGYQKLLTFERPGGGFDWWGNGEPLVWLSAYGLQEFNDMAKVYPIDKGVITRTQAWLMKQQDKDGTWSKIGHFPLAVKATGTKMSDAIRRGIDVLPDGKRVEQVVSDRLKGKVSQTIIIPESAIPDASKLIVKVYPGVMSQVLEGAEGLLRLPGG